MRKKPVPTRSTPGSDAVTSEAAGTDRCVRPPTRQLDTGRRMTIDVDTRAELEKVRTRYQFLDQFYIKK